MIQRIQSLYLLISAVSISILFFLPLATSSGVDDTWFSDGRLDARDTPVMIFAAICAFISFIAIFLYGQRPIQLLVVRVAILIVLALTGYAGVLLYQSSAEGIELGVGFAMPVISLVTDLLASKGILKDEQTVKSMDRLR
jgi:quinol-cytochrome oxidoreductase complex cytochrome b subunit